MSAVPVAVTTLATDAFTTTNTPPVGTAIVVTWSVIASMVLMALIILILAKACGLLRSRRKKTMINAERTAKQGHQSMMSQSDIELGKKGIRQQMEDLMRQQVESEKHATEMPSERKGSWPWRNWCSSTTLQE